jgi:murein DD-endopeptidase MepM/ murein hydrolase activator NlpD
MNDYRLNVHLLIILSLLLSCVSLTDCDGNGNGGQTNSLSIALEGTGSGRVSSVPAGIYCENDCAEDYASDTEIVLSAQPYSGSVFTGWDGGGCSGTGTCNLSMTDDTTVTANFDLTAPAPLSLVTPYANESDMSDINDFFNAQYRNEPWGRIHDGLDADPAGDLKAYQSACAGRVNKLYTFDDQVMVMIDCDMTYSLGYNFECQALDTGTTQYNNMLVAEGQLVAQGETIGYLYSAENPTKAHVHFTLYQNAVPICPDPYFTQAARDSILNLISVVHTDVIMCNSADVMPPLFVVPYSSEAEMAKITAGFSSQNSISPWDYVNDGIDIYPQGDLAGVQAACSGTVDAIQMQQRATDDTWQVEVSIACDEYVVDPDDGGYFIPLTTKYAFNTMSMNTQAGQDQLDNITITLGDTVAQGDAIGHLKMFNESSHLHYGLWQFGQTKFQVYGVSGIPICPEAQFTAQAKASILNLLHVTWPNAQICYQN